MSDKPWKVVAEFASIRPPYLEEKEAEAVAERAYNYVLQNPVQAATELLTLRAERDALARFAETINKLGTNRHIFDKKVDVKTADWIFGGLVETKE